MVKRFSGWARLLVIAASFWTVLILLDVLVGYFFGPQIWVYAAYFFGNNLRITVGVIMFLEGAILLALGSVWASGAMETVFQGGNLKTNPYFRKNDWKQRKEQTEMQNVAGKILLLIGGPILIASFFVVLL
jgi:hypothetical protein